MKLLLDMNIPIKYMDLLTKRGIKTMKWSDIGAPNAGDMEIIAYAQENNFVILTCDLDFSTLLSITHDLKPSIVQIRASFQHPERIADLTVTTLNKYSEELTKGAIISIDLKKSRIRSLPL